MKEIWKDIPNYENLYQASNLGNIKTLGNNNSSCAICKIMSPALQKNGYLRIALTDKYSRKSYQVHRLVAKTFLENKDNKLYINHINGIKTDNRIENLEWCTASENIKHAYNNNLFKILPGKKNSIKINQYSLDNNFIKTWNSMSEPEKELGIFQANIFKVCVGKRNHAGGFKWKYCNT